MVVWGNEDATVGTRGLEAALCELLAVIGLPYRSRLEKKRVHRDSAITSEIMRD